jgi:hypothetical protein
MNREDLCVKAKRSVSSNSNAGKKIINLEQGFSPSALSNYSNKGNKINFNNSNNINKNNNINDII